MMPLFLALGAIAMLKMENVSSLAEKTCFLRPRSDFFSGARRAHVPEDCSRCVRHGLYVANVSPDSASIKVLNPKKSFTFYCYQNLRFTCLSSHRSIECTLLLFSLFRTQTDNSPSTCAKHCLFFSARDLCNPPLPPDALLHRSKSHLPSYMYFVVIIILLRVRDNGKRFVVTVAHKFRVSKGTK